MSEASGSKVLVDNDILRATKVTIHPGDRIEVPSYNRLFYHVISGGSIKVIWPSGDTVMWEPPTDEANWAEHEPPHGSENVGKTTVIYMAVELKK